MRIIITVMCCFLLVGQAMAETRLIFQPGILYFDYEETTDSGRFLDGETGLVAGISAQLEYSYPSGATGIVHGGAYSGTVDYDGHVSPSGEPVQTDTDANFFTLGAAVLVPLDGPAARASLRLGFLKKRWERDIRPTVNPLIGYVSGLYEVYEWEELSLGAVVTPVTSTIYRWRFYAGLFQTIDPRIKINLQARGDGEPRLYMGADTGLEFSAQWMGEEKGNWKTGLQFSYKAWRFGKSNTESISGGRSVTEPRSRTHLWLFEFVLATKI